MKGPRSKGYRYVVSREQIRRHMDLSPQQKLEWLEEANEFINRFISDGSRHIRDRLRSGDL